MRNHSALFRPFDVTIELDPQNAQKVAAVVVELRRTMPPKEQPEPTIEERLADLDHRCDAIVAEFEQLAPEQCQAQDRDRLETVLSRVAARLQQIEHGIHLTPKPSIFPPLAPFTPQPIVEFSHRSQKTPTQILISE